MQLQSSRMLHPLCAHTMADQIYWEWYVITWERRTIGDRMAEKNFPAFQHERECHKSLVCQRHGQIALSFPNTRRRESPRRLFFRKFGQRDVKRRRLVVRKLLSVCNWFNNWSIHRKQGTAEAPLQGWEKMNSFWGHVYNSARDVYPLVNMCTLCTELMEKPPSCRLTNL